MMKTFVFRARLKQNKYPVMFLTHGVTKKYPPFSDPRMWNVENAINFANSEDLLVIGNYFLFRTFTVLLSRFSIEVGEHNRAIFLNNFFFFPLSNRTIFKSLLSEILFF